MRELVEDLMDTLVNVAGQVLEIHDPDESGQCLKSDCVAARLPGRCLPRRIADEVINTWANRVYLPATVDREKFGEAATSLRPGPGAVTARPQVVTQGRVKAIYYPAVAHPTWCVGMACRIPGGNHTHISAPDRIANLLVTLMHTAGRQPVITLTDLTNSNADKATIVVPAMFAGSLAQAIRLTGLQATATD